MLRTVSICLAVMSCTVSVSAQNAAPRAERVVEPVRDLAPIKRVSAAATPSGLPVPRYVSLKSGKTNGRTGPSRNHAIAWQYARRGLPVIVVAETERWRRVRDHRGDESWVLSSLLSGERRALVRETLDVQKKPKADGRIRARVGAGTVVALRECEKGWCEIEVSGEGKDRERGWALQSRLWGAAPL